MSTAVQRRKGDPERAELDARILAWMREATWQPDEARFARLALDLFAFQFEHCEPYQRFCMGRARTPTSVRSWREIPPVPAAAFKELTLRCFSTERTLHQFHTSGTTHGKPGTLHLDTLELYEASLRPSFLRHILPDLEALGGRIRMRILAPSPREAPHSSLSHMFGVALETWGAEGSDFDLCGNELRSERLLAEMKRSITESSPLLLAGTSFAFVHLLDAMQARGARLALPSGSRVMETGGYKGRSRTLPRTELVAALHDRLGVPLHLILNQYGMTELGSQFYDSTLRFPNTPTRKLGPPWCRVRLLDPESMEEVRPGEVGLIAIYDLANSGSVLALQTADLGRRIEDGFEVLGRATDAETRGCSVGADLSLSEEQ